MNTSLSDDRSVCGNLATNMLTGMDNSNDCSRI